MKSYLIILALACVIVAAYATEKCFQEDAMKKKMEEGKAKKFASLVKKCKEENPNFSDEQANNCSKNMFRKAMNECKSAAKDNENKTSCWRSVSKKLGIEFKHEEKSFEKVKEETLSMTLDGQKKKVEDAIADCKDSKKACFCVMGKLKEICSETAEMMKKWADKKSQKKE